MKAIIVITRLKKERNPLELDREIQEMTGLCETSGLKPERIETVYLSRVNPAFYIGSGKAEELKKIMEEGNFSTAIFSENLSSAQQKNLTELTGREVSDRTLLILNIFEQRAASPEGKIQVKAARARYEMTRIYGKGLSMDQQVGMVGTRGSGEKMAEYEKRTLRVTISRLNRELEKVKAQRQTQREKRRSIPLPQISIAGYTNSGKSTLLSALTGGQHNIYTDDRVFATLDPLTKRVKMPSGYHMLFSDTVGFISRLPTFLVAAFKSTLEEIKYSDLIIHLKDISNPDWQNQSDCVEKVLREIGAGEIPVIEVFNKVDKLPHKEIEKIASNPLYSSHIRISAARASGLNELLSSVENHFNSVWKRRLLFLPHRQTALLSELEKISLIEERQWSEEGLKLKLMASPGNMERINSILSID
ncbi:MAG: GTPase HflX [Elusimicrobiota bacterium]